MANRPKIADLDEFARLDQELALAAMAEHYGCNRATIHRTRERLGLKPRRPRMSSERLAKVEQRLSDGWSHAEIARTDGIDPATIRRHFPGTAWDKHERIRHLITASYYARMERRTA